MTGHALTRIYTAPKQQPADTTHRPSISIHVSQKPPAPPRPPGPRLARRALGAMGSWAYSGAREKARPDPAHGRTRTGRSHSLTGQPSDSDSLHWCVEC